MDFKGVNQEMTNIYIIDYSVYPEDVNYPLSGQRGNFVTSLLGSMMCLDKVRVGSWIGQTPRTIIDDIYSSNAKCIVGIGSELLNSFISTSRSIEDITGNVFNIKIRDKEYYYIPVVDPQYVLDNVADNNVTMKFSQALYKASQIASGEYHDILKEKNVMSAHSCDEFINIYNQYFINDPLVAYDIETNARPIFMEGSEIIGFSIGNDTSGVYTSLKSLDHSMSEDEIQSIWDFVKSEVFDKKKLIIHNTMYERPYTLYCQNYEISYEKAEDTLVMARLLKNPKESAGLKFQTQKYLNYPDWETDLVIYIDNFKEFCSRIIFGPQKFQDLWQEILDNKVSIFDLSPINKYNKLKEADKAEVDNIINKIKSVMIDLYTEDEIYNIGYLLRDKFIEVYNNKGIKDGTIPYNWIPDKVICKYGAIDSISTFDLYKYYMNIMDNESTDIINLHKGYELWLQHMYVAYIMERNGMFWDEDLVRKDEQFLNDQATNCIRILLKNPLFEPLIEKCCGAKYKPIILSDYLPDIAISQGYEVKYDKLTDKYTIFFNGKRVAKNRIDEITIPNKYQKEYHNLISEMFHEDVNNMTSWEEMKEIYNPSSSNFSWVPREILMTPRVQMGARIVKLNTLSTSPEFEEVKKHLSPIETKFLQLADLMNNPKELKETYGKEWAKVRKQLYEGFCNLYKSYRNQVVVPEIKTILNEKVPLVVDSFDDEGIINIYNAQLMDGVDQDDPSTYDPEFEWMINFRLFKKSQKLISSYINGSVGRESVVVVDKNDLLTGNKRATRKRKYFDSNGETNENEGFLVASHWMPNTAETGRWRSASHCHPGWTKIKLADGRDLPIEEVVKEFNEGKNIYVYSITDETTNHSKYRIAKVVCAYKSHEAKEFVRITLDNGEAFDCTPDHKLIRRDGYIDYAINFKVGDSLYPAYIKENQTEIGYCQNRGYQIIYNPNQKEWVFCHYLADEYNERNGLLRDIPEDEFIKSDGSYSPLIARHHVDFEMTNNSPENVIRVGHYAHKIKFHAGNKDFYKRSWEHRRLRGNDAIPEFYTRCLKKAKDDPEFAERWKKSKHDSGLESMKKLWSNKEFREGHAERNKNRQYEASINLLVNSIKNNSITISDINESTYYSIRGNTAGYLRWETLINKISYESLIKEVENRVYNNHKIVNIEYVTLEEVVPVYSLSVEEGSHNYVLSAGVCVKNTIPWNSPIKKYYTSRFTSGTIIAPDYCLVGDTKIHLLDGRYISLEDLYKFNQENNINEFEVYSYDIENKKVVPGIAHNLRITKYENEIYEIILDNGTSIKCTGNHPFLTKDHKYIRADQLSIGTSLQPYDLIPKKNNKTRLTIESTISFIKDTGIIFSKYTWNDILNTLCIRVKGCTGNSLKNIERVYGTFENFVNEFLDEGPLKEEVLFRCRFEDQVGKIRSQTYKTYYQNFETLGLLINDATWDSCIEALAGVRIKEDDRIVKVVSDIYHRPYFKTLKASIDDIRRYSRVNHRVVDIKVHHLENKIPVYDMEVDKYHNFFIMSGDLSMVCVHNSTMEVRSLAAIAKDENMLELFREGKDFHYETASKIYQKPVSEVTQAERRFSKAACVLGTTRIALLDGTTPMIKDILSNHIEDQWVYSYDVEKGEYVPGHMINCRETKRVSQYARVYFDDGTYLECTVDHKLLCRDGLYRSVNNLHKGDSIMPFNQDIIDIKPTKNKSYINNCDILKYVRYLLDNGTYSEILPKVKVLEMYFNTELNDIIQSAWKYPIDVSDTNEMPTLIKDFTKNFENDNITEYIRKIERIEIINVDEPIPVYAPSVEKYENFCIVTKLGDDLSKSGIVSGQTFSLLYGSSVNSFANTYCKGDTSQAETIFGGFFKAYPKVQKWIEAKHLEVQKDHRVSLDLSNRFIHIEPEGNDKGSIAALLRKAQNYPIQGTSADLTGGVVYDLQKFIEDHNMKSLIFMYVHDSIEADVYPYEMIELIYNLKILLNEAPMRRMGLPSKADVTLGKSLGHEIELKEIEHNEDFTDCIMMVKGYQDEIYETVENWKEAYKTVEVYDEEWEEEYFSWGDLFILRKAYTQNLGKTRYKGSCKIHINYYL